MAIAVVHEERTVKCSGCKIGLTYSTQDETLHRNKGYLFIKCPRCEHEILTTKTSLFGID